MTLRTTLLQSLNAINAGALSARAQALLSTFIAAASPHDAAPVGPIVVPPIIDTRNINGATVYLYADGSVATDTFNAWAAHYSGPNEKCYGLFCDDIKAVFSITKQSNVLAYANIEANRAQTHSPFAVNYPWSKGGVMQGVQATLDADGMLGPSSALRGTLATRLTVADIDTVILPAWEAATPPYFPTQIDGATAGNFYGNVAS
jgi:hypothetical protein